MDAESSSSGAQDSNKPEPPTKPPSTAAAAAATSSQILNPDSESLKLTLAVDNDRTSAALDQADIDMIGSDLVMKVRDIDGVQLMHARRYSESSHEIAKEVAEAKDQPQGAEGVKLSSGASPKPIVHEVDPLHYRQLVKGIIPLRSSFQKTSADPSSADGNRKSVHFSDEHGYYLSSVRSYDHPVRHTYVMRDGLLAGALLNGRPLFPDFVCLHTHCVQKKGAP